MKDAFKLISWLALILGWLAFIVWALIFKTIGFALYMGVLAIGAWTAWSIALSWMFGTRRRIHRHLGISLQKATFLEKEIGASRVADVRRALESLYRDKSAAHTERFGVQFSYGASFSSLQDSNTEIKPLQWSSFEALPAQYENYPTNAVYLLHHNDLPFAACLYSEAEARGPAIEEGAAISTGKGDKLQVFAESLETAVEAIDYLMRVASVGSVFRGHMLHVGPRGSRVTGHSIRVSERPQIEEERIVLPPEVLDLVKRTINARLRFHRLLQRHGHTSKTGLLLHGVPGTGKTLVAKYLIGSCQNHTAIVPAGMDPETIREAFRLAAYLQPALIVIEDVDLLAERRESNANVTGLQELMNEMDGLVPSTAAIVLMTTNRPEILEPALASRPGRVSQAIAFPLPDANLREKLLRMFCSAADVSRISFETWVQRTEAASPAFLEELTKKAILSAAQRSEQSSSETTTIQLADEDFDQAMHELVVFGGSLTSNILGFPGSATEVAVRVAALKTRLVACPLTASAVRIAQGDRLPGKDRPRCHCTIGRNSLDGRAFIKSGWWSSYIGSSRAFPPATGRTSRQRRHSQLMRPPNKRTPAPLRQRTWSKSDPYVSLDRTSRTSASPLVNAACRAGAAGELRPVRQPGRG